ncbi:GNAT family N-acetyltransferase [Candidatus Microthrix parvicella]|uniref:GNAT family N-acetyltransferase n=1 Tax=Candidatus Neomicrothrix parvicella TaxID=41950 RepID=UPI00036B7DAB|nr:GNAT family N-acetyltransferase [Candidatus Microthrix parvicella]
MNTPKDAPIDLRLRRATADDRPAIIELCRQSLGWKAGDPNEAFFEWKHDHNPFGPSPTWVAEDDNGTLVGLRTFLRWRFRRPDGTTINAVRAVDTATHPDWQGRGIFSRLTLGALDDLRDDGVDCVFNTPNDKSRPGYLKMGWHEVGKVPVSVRLTGLRSIPKLAGARTAAAMWSDESSVGLPADEVLADRDGVEALLTRIGNGSRISTDRTPEFLHWRYRFAALRYRAVSLGRGVEDGLVVFRVRRRGTATEATICEVLVPKGTSTRTAWKALKGSGVDYLLKGSATQGRLHLADARQGFVPVPALGPILTWRPVAHPMVPTLDQLALGLGDIELF